MTSKMTIIKLFVAAAALISATGAGNAALHTEQASAATAVVVPVAMNAVGSASMVSATNAVAFGAAAADTEEAIPASNMAVMLLAALGAMGLVVVRRSSSH